MEEGWQAIPAIPRETQRRARAVFSNGNFYVRVGNQLPELLAGLGPEELIDAEENVHGPLPVLAFVTVFQALEALSDTQASDALRARIDWQYALHLPPDYPSLRANELCAYRQTLFTDPARGRAHRRLAARLCALDLPAAPEPVSRAGCDVLHTVCLPNRLIWTVEALRQTLWALASRWPDLLKTITLPHWYTSYWIDEPLFTARPGDADTEAGLAFARSLGNDARYLLDALAHCPERDVVDAQEVRALERIWRQQFEKNAHGEVALRDHCSFCGRGKLAHLLEGP